MENFERVPFYISLIFLFAFLVIFVSAWLVHSLLKHNPQISEYEDVAAIASKMRGDAISDDVCGLCHNSGVIHGVKKNIACLCTAADKRGFKNEFRDRIDIHC